MNEPVRDTVIVGAGPAGLQLAYFLQRAGRDYLVLEGDRVGGFFARYPRHRRLISINKVHTGRDDVEFNLRHDWNSLLVADGDEPYPFHGFSREYFPPADRMVDYLEGFARRFSLAVRDGFPVVRVGRRDDGVFELESAGGERLAARRVVVATGIGRPFLPDVPGLEYAEGYEDVSVDPDDFTNQAVLILGKGNSAFETADALIPTAATIHLLSPHPLRLAWDSHFVGHLRACNNNLLDTYQLKSQNAVIDGLLRSVERTPQGKLRVRFSSIHATEEIEQIEYDRIIRCTGFQADLSIFDEDCRPATVIDGRFPELDGRWQAVGVPHLYFVGASTQSLDFKRSQSAFIHGFRYNARTLFHLLEERYHGRPLPSRQVEAEPLAMAREVLRHMSRVSSLWQQVGFLGDVLVPDDNDFAATWYRDLPPGAIEEMGRGPLRDRRYYVVQFRFGPCAGSTFDNPRQATPYTGELSAQIHPAVARYRGGDLEEEHHVLEDFLADWESRDYYEPLAAFFAGELDRETGRRQATAAPRVLVRDAAMRLVDEDAPREGEEAEARESAEPSGAAGGQAGRVGGAA
ncbi:MAG TPA: NAD(P)-binding domain-containing protein [Thermoanaerobaculia bacterium]|nr:NAD(P)-binding domain-containing protein [Thermoanaerobaculia bacterium]